jgi:NAD(P)-dependent dehydrogenase (short-subunit alcohol dehydrogenase family)
VKSWICPVKIRLTLCAGLYDNPASSVEDESVYNQLGDILNVYAVNSAAPKILADRLVPHLLKGTHKLVVSLSSGMGSHSQLDEYNAEHWVYSSSKAALNMAMHAFAVENPQIKSILFSPGWMNTSMGGKEAPIDPKIVAEKLFTLITKNIDSLMSGTCIQSEGKRLEW